MLDSYVQMGLQRSIFFIVNTPTMILGSLVLFIKKHVLINHGYIQAPTP